MRSSLYVQTPPSRRPLKIFAFDPMLGRNARNRITVDVAYEPLKRGPWGERLHVVDFDSVSGQYYEPVDLDEPNIAIQGGLDPSESDPRFHQQMVYAVAMRVLENFDIALGRRVYFRRRKPLRIMPHALQVPNAFYHRQLLTLLFGYFPAEGVSVGIPGQTVFACLSQDIVAHEMTHALVDRLRPLFFEPSNRDVAAFHEGFSDIVAIFQHFSFPGILRDTIQDTHGDLRTPSPMIELAHEFGHATGGGDALRRAIDQPDPKLYEMVLEPHARGSLLVAAVFEAFFTVYQRRIKDLVRIATGGTGRLPEGDLHPDLVNRISAEAVRTAQGILTMCIRAYEYLPPVDITFGDYLRAVVTADFELSAGDEFGQRAALIAAFQARGIYPDGVRSLAEESLLCDSADRLPDLPLGQMLRPIVGAAQEISRATERKRAPGQAPDRRRKGRDQEEREPTAQEIDPEVPSDLEPNIRKVLHKYATTYATRLGLDPSRAINVKGFHAAYRFAREGQLLVELVAQFTQKDESDVDAMGGLPLRGGATLIASADGQVRYLIAKPLPHAEAPPRMQRHALMRMERQQSFVEDHDLTDARLPWSDARYQRTRIAKSLNLARLHDGLRQ